MFFTAFITLNDDFILGGFILFVLQNSLTFYEWGLGPLKISERLEAENFQACSLWRRRSAQTVNAKKKECLSLFCFEERTLLFSEMRLPAEIAQLSSYFVTFVSYLWLNFWPYLVEMQQNWKEKVFYYLNTKKIHAHFEKCWKNLAY